MKSITIFLGIIAICIGSFVLNAFVFMTPWTLHYSRLDREAEDIVNLMIPCESGGDPRAYNPSDVDGKPRYGILQFSTETWREQQKRYALHGDIWNQDDQETLAVKMIRDGKAGRWGCFYKISS